MEKVLLEQLNRYMTTYNLLTNYLSGYRKKKKLLLKQYWSKFIMTSQKAFEEQKEVLLSGLYLSVTFDTVGHSILIMVLEDKYGISMLALKLFKDYLRNR